MKMEIHCVPGVDAAAAARDLFRDGAVGIDDIAENIYDVLHEEILEELGHLADGLDIRTQRVATSIGPVFVLRNARAWSAAEARRAVLAARGIA